MVIDATALNLLSSIIINHCYTVYSCYYDIFCNREDKQKIWSSCAYVEEFTGEAMDMRISLFLAALTCCVVLKQVRQFFMT